MTFRSREKSRKVTLVGQSHLRISFKLLSWDCTIKFFFFLLPAIQNFTADRMSLVPPPNSNGWIIPLSGCRSVWAALRMEVLFWPWIRNKFSGSQSAVIVHKIYKFLTFVCVHRLVIFVVKLEMISPPLPVHPGQIKLCPFLYCPFISDGVFMIMLSVNVVDPNPDFVIQIRI